MYRLRKTAQTAQAQRAEHHGALHIAPEALHMSSLVSVHRQPPDAGQPLRLRSLALAGLATALLAACGGGGGAGTAPVAGSSTSPPATAPTATTPGPGPVAAPVVAKPATRLAAARFLTQATFGPTDADIARVMDIGYGPWIDEQLALPVTSHRAYWESRNAMLAAASANGRAGQDQVLESFWKQALTGPDQLRQRMAFALSQIFVISMLDGSVGNEPRAVAAWLDMLGMQGLGTYRELLQSVSLHPMMGVYLSHLRNQKADPRSGRVPDENYAREVMQLFSIGLHALNDDGSQRTMGGNPVETYTAADVSGLARVFTGWSWACPNWPDNNCFFNGSADGASDPDRSFKPMQGYPQYHSGEEKRFLGAVVPPQSPSDPSASLRVALDTLAAHPNVGPFITKQLIQRFVTSNPSPAYVRDVARVFADNGSGVRGDMKAVLKALLMHPEAANLDSVVGTASEPGKLREPVLRLSAFMRAFGHRSDSNFYRVGNTDSASTALGQSPLRSPSVFNFYRPGYIPPGTAAAARGLAVPEMQITHETSVAGFVNYMRDNVASGVGQSNGTINGVALNRRDLQADLSAEIALATDPAALVDRVLAKLSLTTASASMRTDMVDTVTRIAIPAGTASNTTQVEAAKRSRVNAALLLAVASPEFAVQP